MSLVQNETHLGTVPVRMLKIVSMNAETSVAPDGPVGEPLCTKLPWLLLEPFLIVLVQPKSAQFW
jgi:hypothetical protein